MMGTMDSDAFKMYLQNIEEYVMDEEKIVTYKWLSKNFNIHVNTAKQLLYSFASDQKDKVRLTYLIGGFLKNGVGGSVQIVREDNVDKIKSEMKLVTSEHVYSVQKAKTLPDLNILYTVDVDRNAEKDDVKRLGSIKCDHPVLRSNEEVAGLKRKTQSAAVDTNEKKWPSSKKPTVTSAVNGIEDKKQIEEPGNSKTVDASSGGNNANKKEPKKGGIAAMFAAQSIKTKNQNDTEVKSKRAEAKKPKAENGISAFFNRQVNKPLKSSGLKNDSGVSSQSDSQDSPKKMEVDSENTTDNNVKIVEDKTMQHKKEDKTIQHEKEDKTTQHKKEDKTIQHKKETNKKETVSKSKDIKQKSIEKKGGRGKNKKASVDGLPPTKKRKRIVVMSDSEDSSDDGIFDKEEEDEGMCYSPAPQPQQPDIDGDDDNDVIPPTPDPPLKKGRKRIRKLVDNTYMDKDGYMLTRKEYVFESCTESEPEEEKEKENKSKDNNEHLRTEKVSPKVDKNEPSPKKKKVSPQNIKQASIMNFFKKK